MITAFLYALNDKCYEIHAKDEMRKPQKGERLWVDLETPTPEEGEILSSVFNFHPLAIEDCWHEPQTPKIDDYGDYIFIIVHGVRYDAATEEFTTHELQAFLGSDFKTNFCSSLRICGFLSVHSS
jgi:magnesium transporter